MPLGTEVVVIETGGTEAVIAMLNDLVAVSFGEDESAACTVKLEVPAVVGFPEIAPVLAFRLRPAGKLPDVTLQL
jgi:hypothetical protein